MCIRDSSIPFCRQGSGSSHFLTSFVLLLCRSLLLIRSPPSSSKFLNIVSPFPFWSSSHLTLFVLACFLDKLRVHSPFLITLRDQTIAVFFYLLSTIVIKIITKKLFFFILSTSFIIKILNCYEQNLHQVFGVDELYKKSII